MDPVRILVVEDDFLIRMTLTETLESDGFLVIEADSGEAALVQLRSDPSIQLLMTDMQLSGGLSGKALVEAVRKENAILPVIYMTGRPDSVGREQSQREVVIGKPYTPREIVSLVKQMLAQSSQGGHPTS